MLFVVVRETTCVQNGCFGFWFLEWPTKMVATGILLDRVPHLCCLVWMAFTSKTPIVVSPRLRFPYEYTKKSLKKVVLHTLINICIHVNGSKLQNMEIQRLPSEPLLVRGEQEHPTKLKVSTAMERERERESM